MRIFKFFLIATTLVFTACTKDDVKDPSLQEIHDFLTPEVVDAMEDMGFNINLGETPPDVEGSYLASPIILLDSTVEGDSPAGTEFPDWEFTFSNQNNDNLSIFVESSEDATGTTGQGSGALIVGKGTFFTIFVKQQLEDGNGHIYTGVRAISGDLFATGILDFQMANMMLDDNGNPNGDLIPNNTGRLFEDGDGKADRQ